MIPAGFSSGVLTIFSFPCDPTTSPSIYNRDVHPQLFHIGTFALPTYGFMAALGMVSGLAIVFRLARFRGLDPEQMWNLGGIAAFSGILGAKLLLLLIDWRDYVAEPGRIFSVATLQSGGCFFGGVGARACG